MAIFISNNISRLAPKPQNRVRSPWKYLIAGHTLADDPIIVVAKLALTGTLVIITVYRDE
jgi:hypothetical protein